MLLPQFALVALKRLYDARGESTRLRGARRHLCSAARWVSEGCLEGFTTSSAWIGERDRLRKELAWMLGLSPLAARGDVLARRTGMLRRDRYTIEKLVFQCLPGLYASANFYVPTNADRPAPCILYLNGHWPSLHGAKTGFQDRYLWYPAHGFTLLVLDPLGFGEVPGVHQGTSGLNMWHWLSLGYTPAAVEVWNGMRVIDWLETRPEVDATRIGVTGISGGGVMTQFLAALDTRVAVAAPSCSTYTIATQAERSLVPQQCDCTFYPNVYGLDSPTVLALIAPRPLLILGGRKDPIFPPDGFRAAFRRAKGIYDLYPPDPEGRQRIRLVESGQGHTDPPGFLEETRLWMAQWLGMQDRIGRAECASGSPQPEKPVVLACLEAPPATALNYHIHDVWIHTSGPELPATLDAWQTRREALLHVLNGRVFRWFPECPPAFDPRRLRHSGGYAGELANFAEYEIVTEVGVRIKVQLVTPRESAGATPIVVLVRGSLDQVSFPDLDECLPLMRHAAILLVTPRFADRALDGRTYARIERTAALTGRTIAALQVWDVLRASSWAVQELGGKGPSLSLYGKGAVSVVALYAAVLDTTVTHVVLRDSPSSHWHGPPLLTVLRDTDLCETAALLAPRRLTFLREMPPSFEWTRRAYQLLGVEDRCLVQPSLSEAVLSAAPAAAKSRNLTGGEPC